MWIIHIDVAWNLEPTKYAKEIGFDIEMWTGFTLI